MNQELRSWALVEFGGGWGAVLEAARGGLRVWRPATSPPYKIPFEVWAHLTRKQQTPRKKLGTNLREIGTVREHRHQIENNKNNVL